MAGGPPESEAAHGRTAGGVLGRRPKRRPSRERLTPAAATLVPGSAVHSSENVVEVEPVVTAAGGGAGLPHTEMIEQSRSRSSSSASGSSSTTTSAALPPSVDGSQTLLSTDGSEGVVIPMDTGFARSGFRVGGFAEEDEDVDGDRVSDMPETKESDPVVRRRRPQEMSPMFSPPT
jgi:hypothetical protein